MPSLTRRSGLLTATVAAGLVASVALAGCTPAPTPSKTPAASAHATKTPTTSATPLPAVTPTAPPTPVGITCDQVLTLDQLYAYNPNFGADPGYTPQDGSLEKKIAGWEGVACAWKNQTSGDVVQIAIAKPPSDALESLKNAAITAAKPVPTYGVPPQVEGYFKAGDAGQVQIFRGPYWIVAESVAFFEPGDAAPLMGSVLGNLPAS
ncbi:iron ABC transporter ATP-binding protein [Leifsonia sp. 21MFCrub1.1]|uniref:iron ABC transporter ATP-binding protein n=1 Tax=Leifsonia sp. 21MFCrub1.1 TaxID=1798223 RepID=UPI0008927E3C|nr:iron ABC transporter ATP-binding protein [Leifsonia sp. 21MFCrub1.1]SEA96347.1 hypothetical protein SAMN04515680_2338 [Leifsonia sp. 21MFCrub1.1]